MSERSSTDWDVQDANTTVWREDLRVPSTGDSNVAQLIVQSVFGRSGVVTAVAGDYESALVTIAPAISAARPWGDVRVFLTNLSGQVDAAQSAAAAASSAATVAQSAADAANTAATAAQTTANTANSAATAAQTTANTANTAAGAAQTTASAAMPKAGGTFTGQVTFGTTDATILPVGSTVQRPASASAGMLRYNAQTASFEGYTTAWGPLGGGGGTATAIGITPPASPTVGQLWWNSEDGLLYIYYDDATGSTQWVPAWVSPGLADTGIIDIALWYPGVPAASTTLLQFLADRAFTLPASLTGSQGFAGTVPTGSVTIDVRKNGTSQGSVNFAAATATSTFIFASAVAFAPGDRLTLVAPGTPDATLANLSVTLKGTR